METILKVIKRSYLATQLLSGVAYWLIWMFLHLERMNERISDSLIRKTFRVHVYHNNTSVRLFRLLRHHLNLQRYNDEMAKRSQALKLPAGLSLIAFINQIFVHTDLASIPQMKINPKHMGINFATSLGLRVPEQLQGPLSIHEIVPVHGSVMKPNKSFSARGVFIIKSLDNIIELATGEVFHSWKQLRNRVDQILDNQFIVDDSWLLEEYITGLDGNHANNVKFNVFYGKVGWVADLILFPQMMYYITDREGKEVDLGIYKRARRFQGMAATPEEIALVEKVSLEIPAPYIRIDFLQGKDGLVFGEFTPRPGSTQNLKRKDDFYYGQLYHEAQTRLTADLIAGKKFELFNSL